VSFNVGDKFKYNVSGDTVIPLGTIGTVELVDHGRVYVSIPDSPSQRDWIGEAEVPYGCWKYDADTIDSYLVKIEEETCLQEAQRLVYGDRNASYGHPYDDFSRTAKLWSAILGHDVTAEQAALCMCAVKISRQVNSPKRDNMVDLAGYAEVTQRIIDWDEK